MPPLLPWWLFFLGGMVTIAAAPFNLFELWRSLVSRNADLLRKMDRTVAAPVYIRGLRRFVRPCS